MTSAICTRRKRAVRLRRARALLTRDQRCLFWRANGDAAVENDAERSRKAEPLVGLGGEAISALYPDGKGSNIALRRLQR
jgi:hypothetical protein